MAVHRVNGVRTDTDHRANFFYSENLSYS